MKVRTKLIIGFSAIVVLLWVIVVYAGSNFGNLNRQFITAEEAIIPGTLAMSDVENVANHIHQDTMKYILYDDAEAKEAALSHLSRLQEIETRYFLQGTPTIEELKANQIILGEIADFYSSIAVLINLKERGTGQDELFTRERDTVIPALLALQEDVNQRKTQYVEALATAKTDFNKAYTSGVNSLFFSAGLITLLTILAAIIVTRSIVRPLLALRKGTEMIAKGNLDHKVGTEENDEIGELSRAFDLMTRSLSTSMTSIDNLNQEITERKRAEEALKESEEKFSKAFRSSPNSMSITTFKDGIFLEVNDSFTRDNGYTREEVIGRSSKELKIWAKLEERDRILKVLRKQGQVRNEEYSARTKSGEIRTMMFSAEPINIAGEVCILAVTTDITKRKQAEEALKTNEERFRLIADNSTDLISRIQIVPEIRTDYISPSCLRITGYKQEEFYTDPNLGLEMIHPEDREFFQKIVDPSKKTRKKSITVRLVRKDGRIAWIEQTHTIIFNERGELVAIHLIAHEITERKQAEEALRESEERFSKAFRSSPETIAITTFKDGRFLEVNDSFSRITGYTHEEVMGQSSTDINIWANAEDRARMLQLLKKNGKVDVEEFEFRMKSGEIRTWLFSAEKINIDGEPSLISITTDITGRKRAEKLQQDENYVLTLLGQGVELSELLDAIVRLGESHNPSIKGSVMLFDPLKELLLQAAGPSLPDSYKELLKSGVPIGPNMGSCGTAAYRKKRVIVPDIKNSPLFPYKEANEQIINNGLLACWSQPIIASDGDILGTVANYSNKVGEPDAGDLGVLEWSARIAAIAIERKRAEEALANEAIRRRILIDESLDGIVILDENSKVFEANRRFTEMLGYSPEEVLELHTWDWDTQIPPEELLEMGRNIGAEGLHLETKHLRKDGTFIDVDISINGAVCAGQKLIFCVCREVTARKQAEEALRESEEKFSKTFHASPQQIIITRVKDEITVDINDSFTRTTGFTREETVGHTAAELKIWVKPEDRDRMLGILEKQGRVYNEEFNFLKKSGEMHTELLSVERVNLGGEECLLSILTDITERKRAEEVLRFSDAAFRSIHESVIVTDLDGKITLWNDISEQLFGIKASEATGKQFLEVIEVVEDYPGETQDRINNIKTEGHWQDERLYRTKKGEIWVDVHLQDIVGNGKHYGRVMLATDITQRKKAEEKLKQAMLELEQSSARLTATNKELETFSYSVSHDLRSPLRSIDGFSQALLEDYNDKLDDNGQDYLKRLRGASQKMGELIDGLLKLSRLTRSEMHEEPVDLSTLGEEITNRLQENQPERRAKFVIDKGLTTKGDPQLLRVLLENLLGNAWKFTSNTPRAKIEFGANRNNGKNTYFIRDNGAGFDMTYADKLFGAFQRLHDITEFPGTGIGLATVQRIINRHGGTIRAEGAPGKGAAFHFTLE